MDQYRFWRVEHFGRETCKTSEETPVKFEDFTGVSPKHIETLAPTTQVIGPVTSFSIRELVGKA